MPLILAIEPDRRQAAQLSVVVRKRVHAELILVDTTERALDAIGNRMPDLVLVPALLSPQDDAALAAALRVIAAAAHVQMLTIPVLGTPRPAPAPGGVLSALRRKPRAAEPDGCDPAVFAEQIASYLEQVAEERPSITDMAPPPVNPRPPVDQAAVEVIATFDHGTGTVEHPVNQEWLEPLPAEAEVDEVKQPKLKSPLKPHPTSSRRARPHRTRASHLPSRKPCARSLPIQRLRPLQSSTPSRPRYPPSRWLGDLRPLQTRRRRTSGSLSTSS